MKACTCLTVLSKRTGQVISHDVLKPVTGSGSPPLSVLYIESSICGLSCIGIKKCYIPSLVREMCTDCLQFPPHRHASVYVVQV